jgi:hypothetical protein
MDRAATLNLLDAMIESDGAVVLFNDSHPEVPENSWHGPYQQVIERYSEEGIVTEVVESTAFIARRNSPR